MLNAQTRGKQDNQRHDTVTPPPPPPPPSKLCALPPRRLMTPSLLKHPQKPMRVVARAPRPKKPNGHHLQAPQPLLATPVRLEHLHPAISAQRADSREGPRVVCAGSPELQQLWLGARPGPRRELDVDHRRLEQRLHARREHGRERVVRGPPAVFQEGRRRHGPQVAALERLAAAAAAAAARERQRQVHERREWDVGRAGRPHGRRALPDARAGVQPLDQRAHEHGVDSAAFTAATDAGVLPEAQQARLQGRDVAEGLAALREVQQVRDPVLQHQQRHDEVQARR